ncbi:hypothetical protein CROQUDRAFT_517280 [Cronartium quercuum f. sp. fusiforme G11]|uniref:Uncharacterized protein n=1 Tax=Cronartium quercuum f. sp. fusiforme G11 TaxID=708437 RepID=A0A9P6TBP4_9BASI|nr:hypothetical protein CROQUDRAFT_517280 [Cronartium quercuum f. sp. fusiforme G11]
MNRVTFDLSGLAGFGYRSGALEKTLASSELERAFKKVLKTHASPPSPRKFIAGKITRAIPSSLRAVMPIAMQASAQALITMQNGS